MWVSGDDLNKLIEGIEKLTEGLSDEDADTYQSLVTRFWDRVFQALSNEIPPFLPEERERHYRNQSQRAMLSLFYLGIVWERQMAKDLGPAVFRDVIDGIDFDSPLEA